MKLELKDYEFNLIRDFIYRETGIFLNEYKKPLVYNRLRRRVLAHNFDSFKRYYDFVTKTKEGKKEKIKMIDAITTNVTSFFRHPTQEMFFKNVVLPQLITQSRTLNILSAGCASGEEIYTIAIILIETIKDIHKYNIRLLGIDINEEVLKIAREGIYKQDVFKTTPQDIKTKYFLFKDGKYMIKDCVKNMVQFKKMNLIKDSFYLRFNVIFCRNVLIYFDKSKRIEIIDKFYNALYKGGYLFLGNSESLVRYDKGFQNVAPAIYRKIDEDLL